MANEVNDINIAQHMQFLHFAVHKEGDKFLWNLTELETLHIFLLAVLNNSCFTHKVLYHWADVDIGHNLV
jgi:hypothetical protein